MYLYTIIHRFYLYSRVIRFEDLALSNLQEKANKMLHYVNVSMNSDVMKYLRKHATANLNNVHTYTHRFVCIVKLNNYSQFIVTARVIRSVVCAERETDFFLITMHA